MKNLPSQDITSLFVSIDDYCIDKRKTRTVGRNSNLHDSEIMTILLWCTVLLKQKNIKDIHNFTTVYHRSDFPKFPKYQNFVEHCHRIIPFMMELLKNSLDVRSKLVFVDSTMVPVCKIYRADSHRVAKNIAQFGKNHQGWYYGFKLHASVNPQGQLCGLKITGANVYDAQVLPDILHEDNVIAVGDSTYGASVMKRKMWEEKGVFILTPAHYKQKKKVMTRWQQILLEARPKIESVFDYLKEHLKLVSSFPRSVMGYLFHYLRILLAYQFMFTF